MPVLFAALEVGLRVIGLGVGRVVGNKIGCERIREFDGKLVVEIVVEVVGEIVGEVVGKVAGDDFSTSFLVRCCPSETVGVSDSPFLGREAAAGTIVGSFAG